MIDDEADLANITDALEDVQTAAKFRPKPRAKPRKASMASRSQLPNPCVEKTNDKVEVLNRDNSCQEITPSTLPSSEITGSAAASGGVSAAPSDDVSTVSAVGRISQNEDRSHVPSQVDTHQGNLVVSDTQASSSHLGGKTIDDLADFEGLCDTNEEKERIAKFKPKNQLKLSKVASKPRKVDRKALASTIDVASESKENNQDPTDQEPVHTSDSQKYLGTSSSAVDNLADHESILEEPVQEEMVAKVSKSRGRSSLRVVGSSDNSAEANIKDDIFTLDVVSQDARIDSPDEVLTNLVVSDTQASSLHLGGKTIDDLTDFEGLCDTNDEQEKVAKFKPKNQLKLSKAASKSRKVDRKAVAPTIDVASQSKDNNEAPTDQEPVHTSNSQTFLGTSTPVDNLADHESILEEPVQEETVAKVSKSRDVVSQDTRIDSPDEGLTIDLHPKPRDQEAITVADSWPPQDDGNIDLDSQEELINHHIDDIQHIVEEPSAEATANFQPNVKRKKGKGKSVTFILPDTSEGVAPTDSSSERSNMNHYCNYIGADESLNNLLEKTAQKHCLAEKEHSNDREHTDRESQCHEGEPSDHAVEKQPNSCMKLRSRKKVLKVGISEHTADNNFDEDFVEPSAAEQDSDSGEEYTAGGKLKVRRKSRAKDTNKEPLRVSKHTSKDSTVEESQQQKLQKQKGEVTSRGHKRASKDTLTEQPAKKLTHRIRQKRTTKEFRTLLEKPDHEIDRMKLSVMHLRLLQEARERINSKTIPSGPSSSNQSSQFGDMDDFDPFGENCGNGRTENHMFENTKLNYHSYMNKQTRAKWSKTDTDLFYQGLQQFGSDFAMIQQLFPDKTRDQVRQKFKTEEKKHPMQVHDAILHRSRDNSYLKQVIKNLNIEDLPIDINKSAHKQEDTSNEVNPGNENMLDDIIDGEEENDPNWLDKGQGTQVGSEVEEAGEPVSSAKADPDLDVFDWY